MISSNFFLIGILLLLLELFLRGGGYQPGDKYIAYNNFQEVDSLIIFDKFIADSNGITKANPDFNWEPPIKINKDGFRTNEIEYVKAAPREKRILLIGDSFTWGHTAEPITNCYADLLNDMGYAVYNTGIPTVGPNQYAEIAELFIQDIRPNTVAVFFCFANDLFPEKNELIPFQPAYYHTNAGIISSQYDGILFKNPIEAYNYYVEYSKKNSPIKKNIAPPLNWLIKRSVVCSRIYNWYRRINWDNQPNVNGRAYLEYLNDIKTLCYKNQCEFRLFVIPDYGKPIDPAFFEGFDPLIPQNLIDEDYASDAHFYNKGHLKFFEFILDNL